MAKFIPQGMGWIPDLPDLRDYTDQHEKVLPLLQQLRPQTSSELPNEVDLRHGDEGEVYFTDVEDQGPLNSSTAFAVHSLAEYFERRLHGRTFDGSKLFLYKVARSLRNKQANVTGDTGADLRTTLKALCQFGIPDESCCPYNPVHYDDELSPFSYQIARTFDGLRYFRVADKFTFQTHESHARWEALARFLAAGFPLVFGFSVPSSLSTDPNIPFRLGLDDVRGGQAAVAIGYKCDYYGQDLHALLVRTSWGKQWGDHGNGWLPESYIQNFAATDFWTLINANWRDTVELRQPIRGKA